MLKKLSLFFQRFFGVEIAEQAIELLPFESKEVVNNQIVNKFELAIKVK